MKNKIISIAVLAIVAAAAIFVNSKFRPVGQSQAELTQAAVRPLPILSTPLARITSYTPKKGDIKYRLVERPVVSEADALGWKTYESREYNFMFSFPGDAKLETTEPLGYQLPPAKAYKGSRDNFEIKMTKKGGVFFLFFMNHPDFKVDNTTVTSTASVKIAGISMQKEILESTDPLYQNSQITKYSFEKNNKKFIWYGTFDSQDFEAINQFESIVASLQFE